ncbi:MAG TPA: saccharopine dehydrogenase NADP-binding domain-containing protein [Pseudonocardia sp.]|nr:saccharopine dehydrogenase NADP-binding domain-containing protein [Pseudonocardia sp.]
MTDRTGPPPGGRDYDVVLLGGTGFTGGLTAEYLAGHAGAARWALAGRNPAKLAELRDRLARRNPACAGLPLLPVDVGDPAALRGLAESTRVVATTVGPYLHLGEPLVAACAAAGTDYVDLTGEPEFVDQMFLRHQATALATGARIVHSCGFDSIPHDLGTYFTVAQLPEGVPLRIDGYVRGNGAPSGGTFHSLLTIAARLPQSVAAARSRAHRESDVTGRAVHAGAGRPGRDRAAGGWVLPMPTIDPRVVGRSAAALPRYGPDFRYRHHAVLPSLPLAAAVVGGAAALLAVAQLPPARNWLMGRMPLGTGPSEQRRARSWFAVRFVGEGGGRRVVTEVSGGDPGYGETAKMLAESALCLAMDDLPPTRGQVTPAAAMGEALLKRLDAAGLSFTVLHEGPR